MAQLVNNTYANALLELALEENMLEDYEWKAKTLITVLDDNPDFRIVVEHPEIGKADKLNMLVKAVGDDMSNSFAGLFNLILNKNREKDLYGILTVFLEKVDAHRGIMTAQVASASTLNDHQLTAIREKLEKNLNKTITLEVCEDPSLIAGIKITVDGHVIDGTVKKEIEELRNSLLSIELS